MRYGWLKHELGELVGMSFHLLTNSAQELFQQTVLNLYDDEEWGDEQWVQQKRYDYLVWIPVIFRLPEAQQLIEQLTPPMGYSLSLPKVYLSSIDNGPIVPFKQLLQLSDRQLYRLLSHFDIISTDEAGNIIGKNNRKHDVYSMIRRWSRVEEVLFEAATYDQLRYFALLPEFKEQGLSASYAVSILQGIADHLRYRFGYLQPQSGNDWKYAELSPDGLALAEMLIKSAEQFAQMWQDGYAISHIVEACCEVVEDADSAERIVFLLFRLHKHPAPEKTEQRIFTQWKEGITPDDVFHDAFNRVRGVAAGAAMTFAPACWKRKLSRQNCSSSCCVIMHLTVRAALLNGLPFLTHKRHAWGWQLFDDMFRDDLKLLWPLAERQLYYQ